MTREEELASRAVSPAPRTFPPSRGWAGRRRKPGRRRWGQPFPLRLGAADANPDAAWVSVSLNPSPPPPRRLGRGLRLAGLGVVAGALIGGLAGSAPRRGGRGARRARGTVLRAGPGARVSRRWLARAVVLLASPLAPGLPASEAAAAHGWAGEVGRSEPEPAPSAPRCRLNRRPQSGRNAPAAGARMFLGAAGWQVPTRPHPGLAREGQIWSPWATPARGCSDHPLPIPGSACLLGSHPNPRGINA